MTISSKIFQNIWSVKEKGLAVEMVASIDDVFNKCGVEYMLIYGTLLGCIRHGGQIPWDYDMDITTNKDCSKERQKALDELGKIGYAWVDEKSPQNGYYKKLFPIHGEKEKYYCKTFIDIFS